MKGCKYTKFESNSQHEDNVLNIPSVANIQNLKATHNTAAPNILPFPVANIQNLKATHNYSSW